MNSTDASTDKQRLIVVGNGMVGHHCVEQLLAGGALAHYRIEVFGEEAQRAYDRVHLSEYFGGRDAESLAMSAASLYEAEGLTLHLACPVLGIDREAREVVTANGRFVLINPNGIVIDGGARIDTGARCTQRTDPAEGIDGWSVTAHTRHRRRMHPQKRRKRRQGCRQQDHARRSAHACARVDRVPSNVSAGIVRTMPESSTAMTWIPLMMRRPSDRRST